MEPLITNGIDPVMLRVPEKRGSDRDPMPPRRRPAAKKTHENEETPSSIPQHALDDLA